LDLVEEEEAPLEFAPDAVSGYVDPRGVFQEY
jgi:hypothetical protein